MESSFAFAGYLLRCLNAIWNFAALTMLAFSCLGGKFVINDESFWWRDQHLGIIMEILRNEKGPRR
jgi:hypothetical protein